MTDPIRCTGCSACAAVCRQEAIHMEADAEGFLYPVIDPDRCTQCGQCSRVCPVEHADGTTAGIRAVCLALADDEALCRESSSGGAFSLLALAVLAGGGVVFGSAMTADCYGAHHVGVETPAELGQLRGSKYVQSNPEDSFCRTKDALKQGKKVLYTGTPCQVAGLKSYLGNINTENLLAVDVVCHGVPSPMVWRDYLQTLEAARRAKAVRVSFRDKTEGWQRYSLKCTFDDGSAYRKNVLEDLYLRGFVENLYLRPACHGCVFKGNHYAGDLTIGDFWGAKERYPELADAPGISLLIAHTEKGKRTLEALTDCRLEPVPVEAALKHNRAYFTPAPPSPFRSRALREIRRKGTEKTLRRFCGFGLVPRIRKKLAALRRRREM